MLKTLDIFMGVVNNMKEFKYNKTQREIYEFIQSRLIYGNESAELQRHIVMEQRYNLYKGKPSR